ncbi:hypothetical protein [Salinarimonas soli]|uniref:Uncharacterized protein n=1 Tax=Salinarimonas soli TaxID=1638099 RepID=A0A5B2VZZ4_9HYPH|nr:hypothetical protein [Salinarimonas soli]KAA2244278.1 hypothetical protein F0L46_01130 [Salinarimonas soli]
MVPILLAAFATGLGTAGVLAWHHGLWIGALSLPLAVLLWALALIRLAARHRRKGGIDREIDRMIAEMRRASATAGRLEPRPPRGKPPEAP